MFSYYWFGGVYYVLNNSFYLYTGELYWTMTPSSVSANGIGNLFIVAGSTYSLSVNDVYADRGVRPVINLRADVTLTGTGTSTDPYLVS